MLNSPSLEIKTGNLLKTRSNQNHSLEVEMQTIVVPDNPKHKFKQTVSKLAKVIQPVLWRVLEEMIS